MPKYEVINKKTKDVKIVEARTKPIVNDNYTVKRVREVVKTITNNQMQQAKRRAKK